MQAFSLRCIEQRLRAKLIVRNCQRQDLQVRDVWKLQALKVL